MSSLRRDCIDRNRRFNTLKHQLILNSNRLLIMTNQIESRNSEKLRVFIKSESKTIQAADMDTIGHPLCTQTWSPTDKLGKGEIMLSQEQQILLDAVYRAAAKTRLEVEIIDISKYGLIKRLTTKEKIPRIEFREYTLEGIPCSDEIVKLVEG